MGSNSSKFPMANPASHGGEARKKTVGNDETVYPLSASVSYSSKNSTENHGEKVILNVYNLQKGKFSSGKRTVNECLGFGLYHSGLELFGMEWSFAGAEDRPPGFCGIFPCKPNSVPLRRIDSILLGRLPLGTSVVQIHSIVNKMRSSWDACKYNVLQHNCNHFTQTFRDAIAEEFPGIRLKPIPSYVNRSARIVDAIIPGMLYKSVLNRAPVSEKLTSESGPHTFENFQGSRECTEEMEDMKPIRIPSSREAMQGMSVREIKTMMWVNGISWDGCLEKEDLIRAVEAFRQKQQEQL